MTRAWIAFFARLAFVTFGVVTLVFYLQRLIPGSPADAVLGPDALQSDKLRWLAANGLDKPIFEQYIDYITKLFQGDLGRKLVDGRPIAPLLVERFFATLKLASCSFVFSLLLALLLGIYGAIRAGSRVDKFLSVLSLLMISAPTFITGTLFLWIFAVWLDIFPLTGGNGLSSLILPTVTLGSALAALTSRMLRGSLLEVFHEDYIRTAFSKGLSKYQVYTRHALRNAVLPALTILGLQLSSLLGGSVITEQVFTWPGLGSLMIEAVNQRDYNLVSACVVVLAFVHVCLAAVIDVVQQLFDPRVGVE
ncbi:ABC transporter permease [bacterium]|nr:ABC transporter permease [bacterium]